MASALAPELPSGASRGIRARPERDPERAIASLAVLVAASVLRPGGASSLFAGAAPAKLRAYLWAFKSETRARCFFRIMDLQCSCW